jgi:hypothetical protein
MELGARFELATELRSPGYKSGAIGRLCEPSELVRRAGFEPARTRGSPDSRSGVYANSTTCALTGTGGGIRTRKTMSLSHVCMPNSITPALSIGAKSGIRIRRSMILSHVRMPDSVTLAMHWWVRRSTIPQPTGYEPGALPIELQTQNGALRRSRTLIYSE